LLRLLRRTAERPLHQEQFEKAKQLSAVDPGLAKVIVETGDGRADKVSVKKFSTSASSLKPSQTTMVLAKSLGMALFMLKTGKIGGDLGAIVSSDNHIMDGHHRWSAAILAGGSSASVSGYKASLPGKDLVRVLNLLTKGHFGVGRGNAGKGNLNDYTSSNVRKMLEEMVVKGIGGKFPWSAEDVRAVLEDNFGSVEDGIDAISKNAKMVSNKVPGWAPSRSDMPVIDPDQVPSAARKMEQGDVDWTPPYHQARSKTASRRNRDWAGAVLDA
jgi:hypothetical protein